jgi:hypothetical protein
MAFSRVMRSRNLRRLFVEYAVLFRFKEGRWPVSLAELRDWKDSWL